MADKLGCSLWTTYIAVREVQDMSIGQLGHSPKKQPNEHQCMDCHVECWHFKCKVQMNSRTYTGKKHQEIKWTRQRAWKLGEGYNVHYNSQNNWSNDAGMT